MSWENIIKEDYMETVSELLKNLGTLAKEQSEGMSSILELAHKNEDDNLVDMLREAALIKTEYNKLMIKIIDYVQRRENMR